MDKMTHGAPPEFVIAARPAWLRFTCCILPILLTGTAFGQDINPFPREVVKTENALEWTFPADAPAWTAVHDCALTSTSGSFGIQCTSDDPYLFGPPVHVDGPVVAQLRLKCAAGGNGQIFWATLAEADFSEARSSRFQLIHDNQWHDYTVPLAAEGTIQRLRLDPAEGPGVVELQSFRLLRQTLHSLEIQAVLTEGAEISLLLKNYAAEPIPFTMNGQPLTIAASSTTKFSQTAPGHAPFESYNISLQSPGFPPLHRVVSIIDTTASVDWAVLKSGHSVLKAAPDASGARLELDGRLVAVLAPLISQDGTTPKMKLTTAGGKLAWRAEGAALAISLDGDAITAKVESDRPCEGPVLRAFGPLEQGLFPGLEYLAKGEHSSSTLDIETEEHLRFAPDPRKVTMPLMAFVTDRALTAMTWRDMTLQPVFATPNFLDGPEGHRASLRGKNIDCTILVRPAAPMEDAILWAVQQHGLPPLPAAPRSSQEEMDFCRRTLSGPPLKTSEGWGHCAEASWARQPYGDQASTLWRLTGQVHALPTLVAGGAHLGNDSIYFLTGRAAEWLNLRAGGARGIIAEQKPDGSFRYDGKYRRGHFEDTAGGYCASRAVELLEHARLTGDAASLQAGVKALEFMKHFRDPRGAQTWECPLHTPDILASAYLVHAYVRGYELTGQRDYLDRARAWAVTGLPFVYQWSDKPIMAYATIAVFGATGWQAPNWMGLPVQWCGYVYADALTMLAPLDHTLDWNQVATGILTTAEQMQYPSGPFAGCEPDSFNLASQQRNEPAINPCALVSLSLKLEGKLDSLAVATAAGHRVVSPFPVTIADAHAHIQARAGVAYQIVVDSQRILEVQSRGADSIPLVDK